MKRTSNAGENSLFHSPLNVLILRCVGLLAVFTLSRLVFYWFNLPAFPNVKVAYFAAGLRFDLAMLMIINVPYVLLMLLPFNFIATKIFRKIGNIYIGSINAIALLINLIDTCYYPFSMRRMTADIFAFVGDINNFGSLIPIFLKDYFYMIFVFAGFVALLILLIRFTDKIDYRNFVRKNRWLSVQIVLRLALAFGVLTSVRGGWQLRPINPAAAAEVGGVEYAALVLNSPYTLIRTSTEAELPTKSFFAPDDCERLFSPQRHLAKPDTTMFPPTTNVVVIILEGIAAEYSQELADEPKNLAGFTPFVDSLARRSIVFRGFANGQHSVEAVSSILGGIPALMECPFVKSPYITNRISYAIPILKRNGFSTSFYHGAQNGTFCIDRCAATTGVDEYFGLNEYPGDKTKDYDGSWGIADMPYLSYYADELNKKQEPFFSAVFTLSSHNPFVVPNDYDNIAKKGDFPMQHSVAYTDLALRNFFDKISKTNWYNRTLFVFVSDHTTFDAAKGVDLQRHRYRIPMFFFHPQCKNPYQSDKIMQQVDIMPSILAYCGLEGDFFSFGHNVFDDSLPNFAISYLAGTYSFYFDNYLIEFDGNDVKYVRDLSKDIGNRDIAPDDIPDFDKHCNLMKAVIQQFNNRLVNNQLMLPEL